MGSLSGGAPMDMSFIEELRKEVILGLDCWTSG